MKTVVVYDSKFGNTERIAQTIAEALHPYGPVEIARVDSDHLVDFHDADLLVLGSPTQGLRATAAMATFVQEVPFGHLKGLKVACFDTRVNGPFGSAARHLVRHLHALGVKEITPAVSFIVKGNEGPLAEGEVELARTWAMKLHEQYGAFQQLSHQAPC